MWDLKTRSIVFTFGFVILQTTYKEVNTSSAKVEFGICRELVKDEDVSLCCRTENMGGAGVDISYHSTDSSLPYTSHNFGHIPCLNTSYWDLNVPYDVTCNVIHDTHVYKIAMQNRQQTIYNFLSANWTCKTYAGSSSFQLTPEAAVDKVEKTIYVAKGDTIDEKMHFEDILNLKWLHQNHQGKLTNLGEISERINASGDQQNKKAWLKIYNVTHDDAGTYILDVNGKSQSYIIVVKDVPTSKTVYRTASVTWIDNILSVTLICLATSQSSGYLGFLPQIHFDWLYPELSNFYTVFKTTDGDSTVTVAGIDCSKADLPWLGCSAYETVVQQNGEIRKLSNTTWVDPLKLCSITKKNPVTRITTTKTESSVSATTIVAIIFGILAFSFVIIPYVYKYRSSRGLPFCCCSNPFSRAVQWVRHRRSSSESEGPYPGEDGHIDNSYNADFYGLENNGGQTVGDGAGMAIVPGVGGTNRPVPVTVMTSNTPVSVSGSAQRNTNDGTAAAGGEPSMSAYRVELPPLVEPPVRDSGQIDTQFAIEARHELGILHHMLKHPPINMHVHRNDIVNDVMHFYENMDQSNAECSVTTKFVGEEGLDAGGVTKDMYTSFWPKAKALYFKGSIACVPVLDLRSYKIQTFVTLGRIFAHSTAYLSTIPLQICRSTLNVIIFGEMEMTDDNADVIIDDFMNYLDQDDRHVLKQALNDFDQMTEDQKTKLGYIFANFEMSSIPRKETLRTDLSRIAHNELCVKPKELCEQMRKGIPMMHQQVFWGQMSIRHITGLYADFSPTGNKVIDKLRCQRWPLRRGSPERNVFDNLKRFIMYMSPELLLDFLQFVTAERKIPMENISVVFTDLSGLARRPVARTCFCRLELPKSYTKYEDMKNEFTAILSSADGMQMNMA